jgi:small subunit ribosomal protein S17
MADKPSTPKTTPKAPAAPAAANAPPAAAKPAAAKPAAATAPSAQGHDHDHKTHSFRRRLLGRVVSNKMDKTVIVEVVRRARDTVYKKYVRNRDRYKAHDEKNEFKVGDRVEIMEHRPISKEKRWKVTKLISRAVEE